MRQHSLLFSSFSHQFKGNDILNAPDFQNFHSFVKVYFAFIAGKHEVVRAAKS
jgi:hypothetical protein